MKKLGWMLAAALAAFFVASVALAQGGVEFVDLGMSFADILAQIPAAVASHNWPMAAGLVLMLLASGATALYGMWKDVDRLKPHIGLIVALLAVLGTVGLGLVGGAGIGASLLAGATAGVSAVGLKELVKGLQRLFSPAKKMEEAAKVVMKKAYKSGSLNIRDVEKMGMFVYRGDAQ